MTWEPEGSPVGRGAVLQCTVRQQKQKSDRLLAGTPGKDDDLDGIEPESQAAEDEDEVVDDI